MRGEGRPVAPLGTLVDQRNERAIVNKRVDWPYVGLEHIMAGSPRLASIAHSSESTSTNSVFHPGDVLFGKLRPYLRKTIGVGLSGYCSTDILVLSPKDGTNGRYAAALFQSERVIAESIATSMGTKMPRTSWNALRKLAVFAPPLPEQQRIAEILDTLDEAIRKTEQVIAKLQQMKQGLLHDLLTRGINEHGELRDPQRHPEQFKDSPLGRIPKEWGTGDIHGLVSPESGLKPGPFGSALKKESFKPAGYRVYGQEQVLAQSLRFGDYYVSHSKFSELAAFSIEKGDLLMTMVGMGTIGKVLVVDEPFEPGIINPRLMRIRLNPQCAVPAFMKTLIEAPLIRQQFERNRGGGTMPVLNGKVLRATRFPLLPKREQLAIIERVDAAAESVWREEHSIAKLRLLKQGLMDDLLTGRVRVNVQEAAE